MKPQTAIAVLLSLGIVAGTSCADIIGYRETVRGDPSASGGTDVGGSAGGSSMTGTLTTGGSAPEGGGGSSTSSTSTGTVDCPSGYGDCDSTAGNGCETPLTDNIAHCGKCESVCPFGKDSYPTCVDSVCSIGCNSGFGNCDSNNNNGCEASVSDDPDHCGVCDNTCPTAANAAPYCVSGMCALSCDMGFGNCNGDDSDGCELPVDKDPKHCGACGNDCAGGGCNGGICTSPPTTLVSGQLQILALATDGVYLFWTTNDPNLFAGVMRSTVGGNGVTELHVSASGSPSDVVLYGNDVYWSSQGNTMAEKISKAGTNYVVVGPGSAGLYNARAIAVDSTTAWFSCATNPGQSQWICRKVGCCTNVAHQVYVTTALAVDEQYLFLGGNGSVRSIDKSTNEMVDLASGEPSRLLLLGNTLYWTDASGAVSAVPRTGGATAVLASTPQPAHYLTSDGTTIYWTTKSDMDGTVWSVPIGGGEPAMIASSQHDPSGIAVDNTYVYWANTGDGTIMRALK